MKKLVIILGSIPTLFILLVVIGTLLKNETKPTTPVATTPKLTPEEECLAAGRAAAKPGYDLFSAKCQPDGTMCFKYAQMWKGVADKEHPDGWRVKRWDAYVVTDNGRAYAGDPFADYSVDDQGSVKMISTNYFWRKPERIGGTNFKGGECYGGQELVK